MRDLVFLIAFAWAGVGLYHWHRWYWQYLILALVGLLDRPEPVEPQPAGRHVRELTQRDVRWGRVKHPATHPVWVGWTP